MISKINVHTVKKTLKNTNTFVLTIQSITQTIENLYYKPQKTPKSFTIKEQATTYSI